MSVTDDSSLKSGVAFAIQMSTVAGAYDAQDGPAGQEAWIAQIPWHGATQFNDSHRHIWRADPTGDVTSFHTSSFEVRALSAA